MCVNYTTMAVTEYAAARAIASAKLHGVAPHNTATLPYKKY